VTSLQGSDSELDFFVFFCEVEVRDEVWAEASLTEKVATRRTRNTKEKSEVSFFIISN
jgi:hypothetical protein